MSGVGKRSEPVAVRGDSGSLRETGPLVIRVCAWVSGFHEIVRASCGKRWCGLPLPVPLPCRALFPLAAVSCLSNVLCVLEMSVELSSSKSGVRNSSGSWIDRGPVFSRSAVSSR